jgi:RNA polymerase sigma-70 factor (ECF subfamily)
VQPVDEILVKQSKKGDLDAFEKLVKRYESKVFNLAYRILGNQVDAYDIAQETFIRLYRALPSFRGESSLTTWLSRITINVCRDELRRQKRCNLLSMDDNESGVKNNTRYRNYVHSEVSSPEEIFERKEFYEKIQVCLYELSEEHRLILVMRGIQGMSYEEIAEILQCSQGTVKSRLSRARQLFKEKLKLK